MLEKWIRNFIWSGDINKRKLVTVAWNKVCSPLKEGGLGLRSLSKINEGANLKLCWELVQSNMQWAQFLRSRVLKKQTLISYHISSSIWSSFKHKHSEVNSNSSWLLGNGADINFWSDTWCGEPLISALDIHPSIHQNLQSTVNLFINNARWNIP